MSESLFPLYELLAANRAYRDRTLNLIASENAMSPLVESLVLPELGHRYGDYNGADVRARKYTGNRYLGELDAAVQSALCQLFACRYADARPLSGHVAGIAPLLALCQPGDTVLELDTGGGGHRLAEKLAKASLCPLRVLPLPLDATTYSIDTQAAIRLIEKEKPKVVILGSSLFLFPHPVQPLADAVHAVGGYLQFDASHVLGLIAGGAYPNPLLEGADVLTSSTHKTFAGPQGGVLLANDTTLYERIVPAIYPALVTNHHLYRLPALRAVCEEWRTFGQVHAAAVVENARALAAAMQQRGLSVVGANRGFTTTHTVLIGHPHAKEAATRLESCHILSTPVGLPAEMGGTCIRFGVQEVTRRGMRPSDAAAMASLIADCLEGKAEPSVLQESVADLVRPWTEWRFTWEKEPQPDAHRHD